MRVGVKRGKKFTGEKPLFKGMGSAKTRKSKKRNMQKAGKRQKLRREIREIIKLTDESKGISKNYEAWVALNRHRHKLERYLEKFNEKHAPSFDIEKKHFEEVRKIVDRIKSNWATVLSEARYELIGKGMRSIFEQKKKK